MADFLCMNQQDTVNFLGEVAKLNEELNKLTGIAPTPETYKTLSKACDELDKILSPICPKCGKRAKRFITSPARLYDPAMAELPGGTTTYWTGEWVCPRCRHPIAIGKEWWLPKEGKI